MIRTILASAGRPLAAGWRYVRWALFDREALAARDAYFDADRALRLLSDALELAAGPGVRSALLADMADLLDQQADIYTVAFGPDPIDWEGGRDMADSTALAAKLVRLLATAEHVARLRLAGLIPDDRAQAVLQLANGYVPGLAGDYLTGAQLALDGIAAGIPSDITRARVVESLCDHVTPAVGGQAAEVLAGIARIYRDSGRLAGCS